MKRLLFAFMLIGGVFYAIVSARQLNQLQQIDRRLSEVETRISARSWKEADGLLVQSDVDLAMVDEQVYTFPTIRQTRLRVTERDTDLHAQLAQGVGQVNDALQTVNVLLAAGDVQGARESAQTSLAKMGGQDPALVATTQYLQALSEQDFDRAGHLAPTITATLPAEFGTGDIGRAMSTFVDSGRAANHDTQQRIATEVQPLVKPDAGRDSASFSPMLKGRAMIWDFTTNAPDATYQLLPPDLRASATDGTITMFLVTKRENIEQGRYSVSNQPAYQEKVTLSVVYWPDKVSPGSVVIWGDPPPASRPVRYAPEYGTAVNIEKWIANLARQ